MIDLVWELGWLVEVLFGERFVLGERCGWGGMVAGTWYLDQGVGIWAVGVMVVQQDCHI